MAQKQKVRIPVRLDEEMFKKFLVVAQAEGRDVNNHFLHLVRTNVAYYERVHGKIDVSGVVLPTDEGDATC